MIEVSNPIQLSCGDVIYTVRADDQSKIMAGPFLVKRMERAGIRFVYVDVVRPDGEESIRFMIPSAARHYFLEEPYSTLLCESRSKPGVTYLIKKFQIGHGPDRKIIITCTCPAWRFHNICSHIKEHQQVQ
jgi:hypothetical protein